MPVSFSFLTLRAQSTDVLSAAARELPAGDMRREVMREIMQRDEPLYRQLDRDLFQGRSIVSRPTIDGMEIRTSCDCPPVEARTRDWSAFSVNYEGGDPVGYGATEQAAIDALRAELQELKS